MIGTQSYSDATYYDQLGVERYATPEQIRHAYRSLVRLLHPDHQTDPDLQAAAERQLRKLNRIHSILLDPAQRRAYDEYLFDETVPNVLVDNPNENIRKNMLRGAWIVGAISTMILVFWLGSESTPMDMPRPLPTRPAKAQSKTTEPASDSYLLGEGTTGTALPFQDVDYLQRELDRTVRERDDLYREVTRLRAGQPLRSLSSAVPNQSKPKATSRPPVQQALTESPATTPSSPVVVAPTNPLPIAKSENPIARKLGGFWIYIRPKEGQQNKDRSLYPPEFIEVSLREDGGNITGKYRARYRILDRAISPDVNFEISGRNNGGSCACTWHGIGGARGQINLQLLNPTNLKFDWSAIELGTQQGLASGTASLTRRLE